MNTLSFVITWYQLITALLGSCTILVTVGLFFERRINSKFDKIDTRLDKIDARFDKLETKIDNMREYWWTSKR